MARRGPELEAAQSQGGRGVRAWVVPVLGGVVAVAVLVGLAWAFTGIRLDALEWWRWLVLLAVAAFLAWGLRDAVRRERRARKRDRELRARWDRELEERSRAQARRDREREWLARWERERLERGPGRRPERGPWRM